MVHGAKVTNEAAQKWGQTLTTQNGCAIYAVMGAAGVALRARGALGAGAFGLMLLYAGQLQRAAMDFMMGLTALEAQFVSVEV